MEKAIKEIKQKQISPIYVLSGEETYQIEAFKKELTQVLIQNEEEAMNRTVFDLNEQQLSDALMEASSYSFFENKRLIFVENATFLTGKRSSSVSEYEKEELLTYIKSPMEETVLIFTLGGNLDTRTKLGKALKAHAKVIESKELKPFEVKQRVQKKIQELGLEISAANLEYFLYLTDHKLSTSLAEADKFALFLANSKEVTRETIDQLVPKNIEQNIFNLSELLLQKRTSQTLELFTDLVNQGEDVIAMNALLMSKIRLILQVQILLSQGQTQANIVSALKVAPYPVSLAMQQAKIYPQSFLAQVFDALAEQDYRLKTGYMDPKTMFELFVVNVIA